MTCRLPLAKFLAPRTMEELNKHRTPEQEVIKVDAISPPKSATRSLSIGLARYFDAALDRLNYLEYGDPSEYILRSRGVEVPNSPLDSIWVPPRFKRQN